MCRTNPTTNQCRTNPSVSHQSNHQSEEGGCNVLLHQSTREEEVSHSHAEQGVPMLNSRVV